MRRTLAVSSVLALVAACSGSTPTAVVGPTADAGSSDGAPPIDTDAGLGADAQGDAPSSADGGAARPLGTLEEITPAGACPRGATCRGVRVTCPGAEPLDGVVAIVEPTGGGSKGTIVTHLGGGGTGFLLGQDVVARYQASGFRVAAISWTQAWEAITTGPKSIKTAACRPATVIRWVFDVVHAKSRTLAFCGQGQSGGSGVLSYALANYGIETILDYAMLTQGPPFGRMDCGCGGAGNGCASVPALCPEIAKPALPLPGQTIAGWAGTTTCGAAGVTDADLAKLRADSSAADDGDFDYPNTHMSGWYCAQNPNGTTGGGAFYLARVTPKPKVFCSPTCAVEAIYDAANTLTGGKNVVDAMAEEMIAECVPRH